MEQKITDPRAEDLGRRLLLCCRNELYSLYPGLDGAFASLPPQSGGTATAGTDGVHLCFSPRYLISLFSVSPEALRRGYLHICLHLLFLHPFPRRKPGKFYDLACDMAVAQILQREQQPRLAIPADPIREVCLKILGDTPLSAAAIETMLEEGRFPYPKEQMEAAFLFDDHRLWNQAPPEARDKWVHVLSYTAQNQKHSGGRAGTVPGSRTEDVDTLPPGIGDYRKYLRQFTVAREEMELDMDSFDYIYYHLGMTRYGNLPLIEPPESREGRKLEELVIAIDTSGSCSKEIVSRFLGETYGILSSRENFFRRMTVHLVQCDCLVQSAAVIHSGEEWKNYSRTVTIQGRGGTDFTPVFRYVEEQRSLGRLRHLKALLYFTDGDGCFPRQKPDYETAFVFLKKNDHMAAVPKWATVLLVGNR